MAKHVRADVRRALDLLDERIVKLDAGAERGHRPTASTPLGTLVFTLSLLQDVTLQSRFVVGAISNSAEGSLLQWVDLVGELLPRAVQVYTINRQPAARGVRLVSAARLEEIACLRRAQTGIDADVAVRAEQAPRCLDAE